MSDQTETTPDQLLDTFRGRGLKSIVLFTIVVHVVVVLVSSVPFLWRTIAGKNTAQLSEEERVGLAMKEATSSLRKIAEAHGLRPQDLSSRLDGGGPRAPRDESPPAPPEKPAAGPDAPAAEPEKAKSEIEKEIEKVKEGPSTPPVDEEEDLFK